MSIYAEQQRSVISDLETQFTNTHSLGDWPQQMDSNTYIHLATGHSSSMLTHTHTHTHTNTHTQTHTHFWRLVTADGF